MTKANEARKRSRENQIRAWELHVKGVNHYKIAEELGVSDARVSQYIKKAAAEHPVNKLSLDERLALSEERWNKSEEQIKLEIARQQQEGRETVEVLKLPDGSIQQRITKVRGVDPALLRALSTHHDRRARQLNNQLAPDTGITQVNVSMVREFLQQGDGGGKLTAAEWNDHQSQAPIDV